MAKSRNRKPRKKQTPKVANKIVSISRFQAMAAADLLTKDFLTWAQEHLRADIHVAMELFTQITDFLGDYAETSGATEITRIEPAQLRQTLPELSHSHLEEMKVTGMAAAMLLYLDFLIHAGLWSGTEQEFVTVRELLSGKEQQGEGIIELPEVPEAAVLAYFATMPLVQYARNLVQWVGDGKDITATEAVKVRDLVAAAAQVGETVSTDKATADPNVPVVRSMHSVERLKLIWEALLTSELLVVSRTRVTPTEATKIFAEQQPAAQARELTEKFVGVFLIVAGEYIHHMHGDSGRHVRGKLMQQLDLALYPDKPEIPTVDPRSVDLTSRLLLLWLKKLGKLGVVRVGEQLDVDLALMESVDMFSLYVTHDELTTLQSDEPAAQGLRMNDDFYAEHSDSPLPVLAPALDGKSLQLRADLEYAEPPIWRRLVVPAFMNLADLHSALQVAFGWNNSHLHDFEQRSADGLHVLRFSNGEMEEDMAEDEFRVSVGQLARQPKDSFHYNYDYGDSWRLKLVLEKIVDTSHGQLVRCTGGRMRSPVDDIGGIPGWEHAVEILADPRHPDYQRYRNFLGLAPGEVFDPKYFNALTINDEYARLLR